MQTVLQCPRAFLFRTLLATTYKIKKVKKNKINQADGKWQ